MSDTTNPARTERAPRRPANWRGWFAAWLPVLALMVLIFVFSAQPKTAPPEGDEVYFSGVMPIFTVGHWDVIIKKSSHVLGYGLLALLLLRALWHSGMRAPRSVAVFALLGTALYALTDEWHQSFVPGRHASAVDIGIDTASAAIVCVIGWRVLAHKRRTEP